MSPLQLATIRSIAVSFGLVLIDKPSKTCPLGITSGARPALLWIVWIGRTTQPRWRAPVVRDGANDDKYKVTDDGDMKARAIRPKNLHFPARVPAGPLLRYRSCLLYTSPSPRDRQKS